MHNSASLFLIERFRAYIIINTSKHTGITKRIGDQALPVSFTNDNNISISVTNWS
ncbi:MAG TPA: hypothetical protein VD815_01485 [Candidatus Saccharimonadales bacterium]|nr:hypothetical protein [Candidatus Saccharimonadales bacterium]